MKLIWTRTGSILSRMIMKVTEEPVSHCAIQMGPFIIHSNFLGVRIEWAASFFSHSEVIYEVPIVDVPPALSRLNALLLTTSGSLYDFGALLYLGLKFLLAKIHINLPNINLWQDKHVFMCTEFVTKFMDGESNSMITPYGLYMKLRESEDGDRASK